MRLLYSTSMGGVWPQLSLRFIPVWQRNFRVWRKIMVPSILANFGEPILYLMAFGYGLGALVGSVGSLPYMVFLASGILCSSAMFSASFEAMYSAYTRMSEQKTWHAMLGAPLTIDDIVLGEIIWAASKALMGTLAIFVVAGVLGLFASWQALWAIPVIALASFSFAACAMIFTALAKSYDFFIYYFTLLVTPMMLFSGVFFPLDALPAAVVQLAYLLPLAHAVELVRPLVTGTMPEQVWVSLSVIAGYGLLGLMLSVYLLRRRLLA